jgi:histidine triad (HIT) family protein
MTSTGSETCPFCKRIEAGEYDDELSLNNVAVFEPLNPVTPGHLLAVPHRHVQDAVQEPHVTAYVMEHAARLIGNFGISANIITSVGAAASQTVHHLHAHIVPRREGDGLHLPWTGQKPVAGDPR